MMKTKVLLPELLHNMDAYWRAANYLSVGQIYLYDNPLLQRPLMLPDVKHMLLGHWVTTPGQNLIYVHLNRVIKKYGLDMIYVSGPGHGGQNFWCRYLCPYGALMGLVSLASPLRIRRETSLCIDCGKCAK